MINALQRFEIIKEAVNKTDQLADTECEFVRKGKLNDTCEIVIWKKKFFIKDKKQYSRPIYDMFLKIVLNKELTFVLSTKGLRITQTVVEFKNNYHHSHQQLSQSCEWRQFCNAGYLFSGSLSTESVESYRSSVMDAILRVINFVTYENSDSPYIKIEKLLNYENGTTDPQEPTSNDRLIEALEEHGHLLKCYKAGDTFGVILTKEFEKHLTEYFPELAGNIVAGKFKRLALVHSSQSLLEINRMLLNVPLIKFKGRHYGRRVINDVSILQSDVEPTSIHPKLHKYFENECEQYIRKRIIEGKISSQGNEGEANGNPFKHRFGKNYVFL